MSKSGSLLSMFCLFVFFSQELVHEPKGLNNLKAGPASRVFMYVIWTEEIACCLYCLPCGNLMAKGQLRTKMPINSGLRPDLAS